jgi:hypothetical protein
MQNEVKMCTHVNGLITMRSDLDAHLEDLASSRWSAGWVSDGPCCPGCKEQRVNRPNWQRSNDHPAHNKDNWATE